MRGNQANLNFVVISNLLLNWAVGQKSNLNLS